MKTNDSVNAEIRGTFNFSYVIFFIMLIGCLMFLQSCSSENKIKKYAEKELVLKGYEVLELIVLDSKMGFKGEKSSGSVQFTVKDKNGKSFKGKASVKNEKKWLVYNTNTFSIDEIQEIN